MRLAFDTNRLQVCPKARSGRNNRLKAWFQTKAVDLVDGQIKAVPKGTAFAFYLVAQLPVASAVR